MSNTVFNAKELEITNTSDTAISMKDFSKFFCDICLIMYNDNKILDIEDYANFTLTNTKINYNNHKQFLITIRNLDLSLLNSFINCEISLNILNSGFIINANFTKISFVECYVENYNYTLNDLEFEEGYTFYFFYLSNSFLYIKNSGFNNSIMKGNLIYFERSSEIEIENSVFMNNLVYLQFFHGYSSILTIKNSRFTENTGANMFLSYCFLEISNSIIENTTLKYTILEYLILSDTSATLYNLSFNNLTIQKLNNFDSVDATYIYVERKNIEIIDCNFKGTEFYIAVYAENVDEINIIRSQFSGFISENYSTLTIINRFYTRVKIVDSVFRENKSFGHGGGLFLKNCDIEINNTTIYSNFANNSGGGIYYTSPVCGFCKFSILGDTKIFNNSCMNQGGGIYWVNYKPYIEKDYLIINNSASYGANIASIPARIGLPNDSCILVSNTISVTNVSPGKIYKKDVVVCLYDTYGQIITTENSIFLTMSSNETTNSNSSVFGTTTFKAKNGFFYLKNFVLSGQPNSDMYLKLQLEGLITTYARNDENNYTNTAIVHIEFRNCTKASKSNQLLVLTAQSVNTP